MTTLVADTGPINYLLQIQEVALVPRMFREVLIPPSVQTELLHPKAPPIVRNWITAPSSWLQIEKPNERLTGAELGVAEIDAISLAAETGAWLLIDDQEARSFAHGRVARLLGTIGILELASAAGFLELNAALRKLRETSHRHSVQLIEEALARDQVRTRGENAK